ncbi:MAG: ketose-bisphosphate aldolase [Gammaproteobacteria bacterium]|jgi:fructose-bisphosphate aldolase class II|nr:ketose-bisphosphate aldolase [Gammaproteobacteria bacterium]
MAMVHIKDLLYHAYNNRYAVGAFEIVSLDFLQAVIDAAEKARSPVILNIVEPHFGLYDLESLMTAVVNAAKRASVPVAVHMDHCGSLETVQTAIRLGCNSVMFDAATESFPVNVELTRNVVTMAHACGIPVEGEIGYVTGFAVENGEPQPEAPVYTSIEEAKAYIDKTGVDFLAVSIGTVHGRTKTKHRLDYTRLSRIQEKVNIPCVIHGGTGLTDRQFHKLIDHGVAKINYYTVLADAMVKKVQANINRGEISYQQIFAEVRETIAKEVQRCMQLLNSAGRAAEVLIQCQPWHNVEHVIVYQPSTDDQGIIQEMLYKGKQDLSKIPGVLDVQIGRSVDSNSRYTYCWLIRFAHEDVLESYKNHPTHVAYADQYFRPIAADRMTTDYEMIDTLDWREMPSHASAARVAHST